MLNVFKNVFGTPQTKKRDRAEERIGRCPWPNDIAIERSSFIGGGNFSTVKGQEYHSVSCAADGPNGDKSWHHGYIGYWGDFKSFEGANEFAGALQRTIQRLVDVRAPIYASTKDKNRHSGWIMGDKRYRRPTGTSASDLPTDFADYE